MVRKAVLPLGLVLAFYKISSSLSADVAQADKFWCRAKSIGLLLCTLLTLASDIVAAASNCQMVQIAELPVRLAHNKLIVDGAINGQKIGIMLDTGSMRTLIVRSAAVRLGLVLQEVRGQRLVGIGGETHVEAALVDEFKIGQATRKSWRMLIAGEHDLGDEVAVILGEDFFHQIDVEFDLAHNALRLFLPRDCDDARLAYWATDGAGEAGIEAVDDASPRIVLTVQINGQPMQALLDSGAGTSVLAKADAARLGVTPETPGVVAIGAGGGLGEKLVNNWIGPFETFTIGNEVIRSTQIRFADLWKDATYMYGSLIPRHTEGQPQMLLGADFIRAHRLLVSHRQRKIYFTYAGGPVFQQMARPAAPTDSRAEAAATAVAVPLEDATAAYRRGDYATALPLFRSLSDQGNPTAQIYLGYMSRDGRGVAKDDAEAVKWFRKGAEQGDASGQNALGFMYRDGLGVTRDDAEAVQWFRKAAEQGNANGENNLGRMYRDGRGITLDDTAAVAWFRKAAERGNAFGQTNLGYMYEQGRGVPKDETEAVTWYRKGAEQGNTAAQTNLGLMYRDGRGISQDQGEAARWLRKAAEQGDARAKTILTSLEEPGRERAAPAPQSSTPSAAPIVR